MLEFYSYCALAYRPDLAPLGQKFERNFNLVESKYYMLNSVQMCGKLAGGNIFPPFNLSNKIVRC